VGVEYGTLRLVLDQEGVRADEATGVPHLADTDSGTRAAAKRTKALRDVSSGTQEAILHDGGQGFESSRLYSEKQLFCRKNSNQG